MVQDYETKLIERFNAFSIELAVEGGVSINDPILPSPPNKSAKYRKILQALFGVLRLPILLNTTQDGKNSFTFS